MKNRFVLALLQIVLLIGWSGCGERAQPPVDKPKEPVTLDQFRVETKEASVDLE